ncbi:hypothetical protein AB434_2001 [Heyndrickxia coagulans]|nr:hypothetical protein AB434_2001 [Heyndrickxia coagulans]ATW84035.1 hypothetical protein CIW84_14140 [Heyndrickxia coagulans]AVD55310.1 hypothetical protein C3766_03785 [Heyndrickxia coagulans]AWP36184.1 hypothetical protein CYJ15_03910 [Heyndrickxia coagulans]KXT21336.1 hypothetical protein UZ35_04765 [Heyndrickxia coagulans]
MFVLLFQKVNPGACFAHDSTSKRQAPPFSAFFLYMPWFIITCSLFLFSQIPFPGLRVFFVKSTVCCLR